MNSKQQHRPRILHVYKDYFPPVLGGVEMTINLLTEGCQPQFQTSVLVNSGSRAHNEETINGVRVVRIGEWGRAASAPLSPAFAGALAREAKNADILHFHHPNPTGDLARFLARPSAPAVMTYHSDVVRQRWAMAGYGPLQNWMMSNCKVIMPTSPNYVESSKWLQRHREKCTVVPLGIRTDEFEETEEVRRRVQELLMQYSRPIVLFVGRLRYYKGLHFLLEAMKDVPANLILAGTGPMESQLREQVSQLQLQDRIHFIGEVTDTEKIAWYYAADVFCMPSHLRSEAFGLSQVEAMLTGLPVVSTRIASGVPFVNEDGTSGLTVEPENPPALAEALNRLLQDEELRARLAVQARDRAQRDFSAARMCKDVMNVYFEILGSGPTAASS